MLRWIDRLIEVANWPHRFPGESEHRAVLKTYARARAFYEKIAEQ